MKKIVLGFSTSRGKIALYSRLIRYVQGTPFSHVYIKLDWEGQTLIYQASGLKVNFETEQSFLTHSLPIAEFDLEVSGEAYTRFAHYVCEQLGKPYDFLGAIALGVKLLVKRMGITIKNPFASGHDAYFCSELASEALDEAGLCLGVVPEEAGPKEVYEALIKREQVEQ